MPLRSYYASIIGITLIIMAVALLVLPRHNTPVRNPDDIVWMERIRRNVLETLIPVRARITVQRGQPTAIRVSGIQSDHPLVTTVDEQERLFALELINNARRDVMETSEWSGEDKSTAPRIQYGTERLYQYKDYLWAATIAYIDTLHDVYSGDEQVLSSEIILIENQLKTFTELLSDELALNGLEHIDE